MPLGNSNKVGKFGLPQDGGSDDARYVVGTTALNNGLSDAGRLENVFGEFIENVLDANSYDLPSMGYYYFLLNAKVNQCIDKLGELEGNNSSDNANWGIGNILNKKTSIPILPRDFVPSDASSTYNIAVYDYNNTSFGIRAMSSSQDLYGFIEIPIGYKITTVTLNCYHKFAVSSSPCYIYESYLDETASVVKSPGLNGQVALTGASGGAFSQTINITDITGDGDNYLGIKIDPATDFRLYGGKAACVWVG